MYMPTARRRRMAPRRRTLVGLVVLTTVTTVTTAACGSSSSTSSASNATVTLPPVPAGTPPCSSASLSTAGRSIAESFGTSLLVADFTNSGTSACALQGAPDVTVLDSTGATIATASAPGPYAVRPALLLRPGVANAANLAVLWLNWCQPPPTAVSLQTVLAGGGGTVTTPIAPPLTVPQCAHNGAGHPSSAQVITAYGPGAGPK